MTLFTRRRLLATAPATGLALGATAALLPATASAASTGTVRFVDPFRLTDSRIDEPFKYGTGARDSLAVPGPRDYYGVVLNVTVTETEGVGFFRVAEGFEEPAAKTSNVNWYGDGQTIANMAIVSTPGGTGIQVQGGGDGAAHLIIDVLGYIL